MNWQPLNIFDIPDFIEILQRYPLAMSDEIKEYPFQYYTLRVYSPDTEYVYVPEMAYMALDPIMPHDAVVHFVRNPSCRARKEIYLDMGKSFMLYAFSEYNLTRLSLFVVDGAKDALVLARKLGFTHEGIIRNSRVINGIQYHVHLFGILKGEI